MRLRAARARLAKPDLLAKEVTGGDQIGVLRTSSTARIARGKFGRMCTYLKAIIHLVSHSRPDIFPPPMREVTSIRWAYFGHPGMSCRWYVRPLFRITAPGHPEVLISASPDTKLARGFIPARLHKYDREECHVSAGTYVHCTKFLARFLSQGCFAPLRSAKARSSVCVCVGGVI
jgi:hypothetical protein